MVTSFLLTYNQWADLTIMARMCTPDKLLEDFLLGFDFAVFPLEWNRSLLAKFHGASFLTFSDSYVFANNIVEFRRHVCSGQTCR